MLRSLFAVVVAILEDSALTKLHQSSIWLRLLHTACSWHHWWGKIVGGLVSRADKIRRHNEGHRLGGTSHQHSAERRGCQLLPLFRARECRIGTCSTRCKFLLKFYCCHTGLRLEIKYETGFCRRFLNFQQRSRLCITPSFLIGGMFSLET